MRSYNVISADSHIIEPPDLWLKYIDPKFRERAPRIISQPDTDVFYIEGVPAWPMGFMGTAGKPKSEITPNARFADLVRPGAYESKARVKDMDLDGVDAEVVYPTQAMRLFGIQDMALLYASMEAYNNWLADFCHEAPGRLQGAAMISLEDMDRGIRELRRIAGLGLATAMVSIEPGDTDGYTDSKYDSFWAAAQELDMPIGMHVLTERHRVAGTTEDQRSEGQKDGPFKKRSSSVAEPPLTIQRTLQTMLLSGVFQRFPRLKVVSVESGAAWAVFFLERLDEVVKGETPLKTDLVYVGDMLPSEVFHRNVFLTFIRDKNGVKCRDIIGVENMMWSSDFPHPVSTWPHSRKAIEEHFVAVPDADRRKIVAENAMRLYGFGDGR